jgi:DNA-binding IclR family transcriptional regulator
MKLSKSTAYRLILSLSELRLVERLGTGEGFVVGPLVRELAGGQLVSEQLYLKARAHMAALRDQCGETVGLHTVHGGQRMLLGQETSPHEHRWVFSNVRVPMPLHAGAASKMLLASLPANDATALLSSKDLAVLTANTPHSRKRLLEELESIRQDGYAISHEEVVPGVVSLAVPVPLAPDGAPVVLSVTGPSQRLSDKALKALLPVARATATRIAAQVDTRPQPMLVAG